MQKRYTDCPVEYTASLLSNKWKILILRELLSGVRRYSELSHALIGISGKVLTENLRELEEDKVIARKVYAEVPPKVEYSLTEKGKDLGDVVESMKRYGLKYKE